MPLLTPSEMLCFSLYSAAHAMQQAYKPLLEPLGLTYPQFLVLSVLWRDDDVPVGVLGRHMQLETNTLTPLLKRMESRGWVTRRRSETDERQVRVRLTQAGRALQTEAETVAACFLSATGLDPDTAQDLQDSINALRDSLRAAGEQ